MNKILLTSMLFIMGLTTYGQNYNDLFTTYQNANTQQSNGVTQYQTIDPNQFYQSIAPQNVQMVNGVFPYQGKLYSVKLKVGVSGTDTNQIIVCGFWDGQNWHNSTSYASKIGTYAVPEQIRMACTHQAYISSLGTVYF